MDLVVTADSAWDQEERLGGTGWVIRATTEGVLTEGHCPLPRNLQSSVEAEYQGALIALREAQLVAHALPTHSVTLHCDCEAVRFQLSARLRDFEHKLRLRLHFPLRCDYTDVRRADLLSKYALTVQHHEERRAHGWTPESHNWNNIHNKMTSLYKNLSGWCELHQEYHSV